MIFEKTEKIVFFMSITLQLRSKYKQTNDILSSTGKSYFFVSHDVSLVRMFLKAYSLCLNIVV